jgi:hypothetical protein
MIDRIFAAALTFCLLCGGTLAIGSALFGLDRSAPSPKAAAAQIRVVQLERVEVVGKRLATGATMARTDSSEPATQRAQ